MPWLNKLSDIINNIILKLLGVIMILMTVVVFAQVIFRMVSGSLPWSEEFARYMMIYAVYLGASVGVKRGSHIAVEFISTLLPPRVDKILDFLVMTVSLAFFLVLIFYSSKIMSTTMMQTSPAMKVRMGYIYAAITIGAVLMTIHIINNMVNLLKSKGEES